MKQETECDFGNLAGRIPSVHFASGAIVPLDELVARKELSHDVSDKGRAEELQDVPENHVPERSI